MEDTNSLTTFIGRCNFRGNERVFGIKAKDRRQHMYVIGKTGVGKTALLKNLALQDIRAGKGVCIIDPHGEFVEEVLGQIPSERANDVVYFNPVDTEYPIGFNVLEVPDQKYKHLVVSDLLGIFTKIWSNVWSARMEYILQNCIMALLDTPGTTLLGIPRLLVDKDYRQKIVSNIKDPVVRSFWVHEYETWRDQFRNEAIVPIQNKVNQFLNTSFIRNIVGQEKSSLNIPEIMNSEKILLVNVSKGKIGEDNSGLLGAMIITKIQLAAMERVRILEDDRKDFYLYVDEFQNFATDSFANILSESRKYRLNLILAHQYVGQLVTDNSTKVRDAVFGNVGTMIVFRVGAADAEELEKEFNPEFMMNDLIGLPNHNIYLKIMVDGVTSRPFSAATLPPLKFETAPDITEKIMKVSRERYAQPRVVVEEKISRWSGMVGEGGGGDTPSASGTGLAPGQLIETPCWNCGKTATVPFKPDGKRPVYCMSCLKQIEEGKLIPLPERMPQIGKARFSATLEALGIEFDPKYQREPVAAAPRENRQQQNFSSPRERERSNTTNDRRPPLSSDRGRGSFQERNPNPTRDFPKPQNQRPREPNQNNQNSERGPREYTNFSSKNIRSKPLVRTSPQIKPVSLGTLKPREETKPEKTNLNPQTSQPQKTEASPGLKEILKEALAKAQTQPQTPSAPVPPKPPIQETHPDTLKPESPEQKQSDKNNGNIVKPGDVIQF